MLRISKLTDYGTLILAHMAGVPDRVYSAAELSEALNLGLPTVSKVLKTLGRHQIVTSRRGARGGFSLARPARQISLAQIVDALEEQPCGLTECSARSGLCSLEASCLIRDKWRGINTVVRDALQAVSVTELIPPPGVVHAGSPSAITATLEHRPDGPGKV